MRLKLIIFEGVMGGAFFWGSYGLIKVTTKFVYSDKFVLLLTFGVPFLTCVITWLWYKYALVSGGKSSLAAMAIGILGPLIFCWLYSFVLITIPAIQTSVAQDGARQVLWLAVLAIVIAPLSVLTYTGMLGAMIGNAVVSLILGLWLSRR